MRAKALAARNPRHERLIKAAIGAAVLASLLAGVAYAQHLAQGVAVAGPVYLAKVVKQIPKPDIPGASRCGDQNARPCSDGRLPLMRVPAWSVHSLSLRGLGAAV